MSSFPSPRRPAHDLRLRPLALGLAALCASSFCVGAVQAQATDAPRQLAMATPLQPVVITGTRFADEANSQPIGVSVITAQEIRRSGATTVNQVLMQLLGVTGRQDLYGGGDYALDLRGFGSTSDSNMVIVVDGVRISEGDTGGTRLAGIPIDTVDRIEVLRGSGAVLYGEGATGGVIVISTKAGQGRARKNAGEVYAETGSFRTRELRAATTLVAGDVSLDVAAHRRLSDGHRDNFDSAVRGASVAGQWSDERSRVVLRHGDDRLDARLPGELSFADYQADPSQTRKPNDFARIHNTRSTATLETRLADWQLGLDVGWRDKSLDSVTTGSFGASAYDYDVEARSNTLRARRSGAIGGLQHKLSLGLDTARWTRITRSFDSQAVQRNQGLFLKDDVQFGGGRVLSVGLRRESIEKENINSTPRIDSRQTAWELGWLQPLDARTQVYGRLGRSFRLANVDEFSFTNTGDALRPQVSRDTEVGARWRTDGGRIELRAYRSALTDEIGFDPNIVNLFGGTGANVNFDPTRRQGIELESVQALSAALEVRASATLRQARFVAGTYDGKDVPLVSRRVASVGANWAPLANHRVGASLYYASQQHPDYDNSCRMPAVTTLGLRYAYALPGVEFSVSGSNVTDRKYFTQAFRCAAGQTEAIYPEPGRALTAAMRLSF